MAKIQGTDAIITGKPKTYTGGFMVGPQGTPLPMPGPAAFAPLDAALKRMGYVGPDGFTKNSEASDEDEYAWGGVVVNTVRTEFGVTYELEVRETANYDTLVGIFGADNVVNDEVNKVLTVKTNAKTAPRQSVVFEMLDRKLGHREVIPNAQILASGEQTFAHGASTTIPITIKAYPDQVTEDNAYNMKQTEAGAATGSEG